MKQVLIGIEPEDTEKVRAAIIKKEPGLYLVLDTSCGTTWPWTAYDNTGDAILAESFQTMEGAIRWLIYEGRHDAQA